MRNTTRHSRGFTLVELLVVIGIIALLIALLLPSLQRAKDQANSVKCKSQMRQMWTIMMTYMNDNHGWLFPVGKDVPVLPSGTAPSTLGTNVPPWERWPVIAFKFSHPEIPPLGTPWEMVEPFGDSSPWTPPYMVCPTDYDPRAAHSYILNKHLADKRIKFSTTTPQKKSSDIIVMGEKKSDVGDYYMEKNDTAAGTTEFDRVVEKYRHGVKLGSNYLYKDGHVDIVPPLQAMGALDPWD